MNGQQDARAPLTAELSAAMIALRVAELRLLAATTAVVWGRSPRKSFEQIASAARQALRLHAEKRLLSAAVW